jgi:hypothetical protein
MLPLRAPSSRRFVPPSCAHGDASEAMAPSGPPQGARAWRIEVEFDEAGASARWRFADTAAPAPTACCTGDPL